MSESATGTVAAAPPSAGGVRHTISYGVTASARVYPTPKRQSMSSGSDEKTSNGPPRIVTAVPPRVGPPVGAMAVTLSGCS